MSRKKLSHNLRSSLEILEARTMPAISFANGLITITGTDLSDTARITYDNRGTLLNIRDDRINVSFASGNTSELRAYDLYRAIQTLNGMRYDQLVTRVEFYGRGGDDIFSSDNTLPVAAYGETGNDSLYGGTGNDTLEGGSGADYIRGESGDDIVSGYYRDLVAADGNDTLLGGTGRDTLSGGAGNDFINGDEDADSISGDGGNDALYGGSGQDSIHGAGGNDSIYGDADADWLAGEADNDSVYGGDGNDTLYGGTGADVLRGELGDDTAVGDDDADQIYGGLGNDSLQGAGGADVIRGEGGNDTLSGGDLVDSLYGGDGDDLVRGDSNADWLYGNDGNDTCYGAGGDDHIYGHAGDDDLYGEDGRDRLFGWLGNDELFGGSGNDWLEAGSVDEAAVGGSGEDFNAHVWAIDSASYTDINQQGSPTCVFLSTLSSLARTGQVDLEARISYLGDYTYRVQIYSENEVRASQDVFFDGGYVMNGPGRAFDGGTIFYDPAPAVEGESWVILTQRAYAMIMAFQGMAATGEYRNYEIAYQALTGHTGTEYDATDLTFNELTDYLADGDRTLVAGTKNNRNDLTSTQLINNHAYTILATRTDADGNRFIQLRNPWGVDGGTTVTGSANDGVIEISWADFRASFDSLYIGIRL